METLWHCSTSTYDTPVKDALSARQGGEDKTPRALGVAAEELDDGPAGAWRAGPAAPPPERLESARHVKMQMGIRSLMMSSRTAPSPAHRLQMQKSARELAKMHGHMSSFRGEADDIMAGRGGGKE